MDIRQLRYFVAVVDSGSFSAASASLRISQPSIGQQVRNLEAELDTNLFHRHSRGIEVTETGRKLAEYSRQIITMVDEAARKIRDEGSEPSGAVRIGLTLSASGPLAVPVVAECRERFPQISLSITEALSNSLIDLLADDELDLALGYVGDFPEGLRGEALAQEDFHFCVSRQHPLADRYEVTLTEVLEQDLLLPPETHMLRKQVLQAAQDRGIDLRVSIVVQSIGTLSNFVEHGIGATIMPYSAIATAASDGRVSAIPITDPKLTRTMSLAYTSRRPMTKGELALRDIIRHNVKKRIEEGTFKWRVPKRETADTAH